MIDLSNWKLTLPVDNAREVYPPQLVDYEDDYFFRADEKIVLRCPVDGDTTPSAKYPRCELREMIDPRDDNKNWRPGAGGPHELTASIEINLLPSTGKLIVAQLHAFEGPPPLKVQYEKSDMYALFKTKPDAGHDKKIKLGNGYTDIPMHVMMRADARELLVRSTAWLYRNPGRSYPRHGCTHQCTSKSAATRKTIKGMRWHRSRYVVWP